ncbi:MAG: hypothetical protein GXP26_07115 [Planctomycetes bacterium]|nr:hypothetical protein [Planctomycetota bacterium]
MNEMETHRTVVDLNKLLVEYTNRLTRFSSEIESLQDAFLKTLHTGPDQALEMYRLRLKAHRNYLNSLANPINELARRSSQWIEHGVKTQAEQAELSLRMADLQGSLHLAQSLAGFQLP